MAKNTIIEDDSWLPPSGRDLRIPKLGIDEIKMSQKNVEMSFDYLGYHVDAKPRGYKIFKDGKLVHEVDEIPTVVGTQINRSLTFIDTLVNDAA